MVVTFLGMFFGMLVGMLAAGPIGGALGLAIGGIAGMLLNGARDAVQRLRPGSEAVQEEQSLLCIPKGQLATATFVRDASDGRWLDVARCSLCPPEGVGCAKRCLHMIRTTLPPRRHPVVRVPPPQPAAP